jgi:hypothetical protein
MIKVYESVHANPTGIKTYLKSLKDFRSGVESKLNEMGYVPESKLNMRQLLKKLNSEDKYILYKMFSETVHGVHSTSSLYQKNLGTEKKFGEFISEADWILIYHAVWPAFELAANGLHRRCSVSHGSMYDESFTSEFQSLLSVNETLR